MFYKTAKRLEENYEMYREKAKVVPFAKVAESIGFSLTDLTAEAKKNSDIFKTFAYHVARQCSVGRVSSAAYAGAVATLLDMSGIDYKVKVGTCFPIDCRDKESEIAHFNNAKKTKEHPLASTHIFLESNGKYYELLNNASDSIKLDIIDYVKGGAENV
mgnify:CR=1 FL=1